MQYTIPLAVGIGGFIGALLRFYISGAVVRAAGDDLAFLGTLTVNLVGCLLIGVLAVVVLRTTHLSPHAQRVLITGVLGSLTTFSTFALDSVNLLQQGRVGAAIASVLLNVVAGIALAWLGFYLAGSVLEEVSDQPADVQSSESASSQ